jgi:hypothetical protein
VDDVKLLDDFDELLEAYDFRRSNVESGDSDGELFNWLPLTITPEVTVACAVWPEPAADEGRVSLLEVEELLLLFVIGIAPCSSNSLQIPE